MPPVPYSSLMHYKDLIFNGRKIKVYDCRPRKSKYIYRDMEKRRYTSIDAALVEKCMAKIVDYLNDQFPTSIEFEECRKVCKQPERRFFVAVLVLDKFQQKIWKYTSAGKEYLQLKEKRKRTLKPPKVDESMIERFNQTQRIQVAPRKTAIWMEKIRRKQKEDALKDYRQRRETYGR